MNISDFETIAKAIADEIAKDPVMTAKLECAALEDVDFRGDGKKFRRSDGYTAYVNIERNGGRARAVTPDGRIMTVDETREFINRELEQRYPA